MHISVGQHQDLPQRRTCLHPAFHHLLQLHFHVIVYPSSSRLLLLVHIYLRIVVCLDLHQRFLAHDGSIEVILALLSHYSILLGRRNSHCDSIFRSTKLPAGLTRCDRPCLFRTMLEVSKILTRVKGAELQYRRHNQSVRHHSPISTTRMPIYAVSGESLDNGWHDYLPICSGCGLALPILKGS